MMKRSSKTARSNSARGFSGLLRRRRITRPQRDQTGLSRGEFFQTLEGRTLLTAIPAGWEPKPVAVTHFLPTAHAIAPQANLVLYEASNAGSGLYSALTTARNTSGITVVSMSWGGSEFSGETSYDGTYFTTPSGHIGAGGLAGGITFVSSSGDQ